MDIKKTSIQEQTPATTNSIDTRKPNIPSTSNVLEGYVCNSWNGGIIKPIAFKKIMAGEKITKYSISGIMRMITPKVPVAQKLTTTFKIFFVPNSRVWKNHDMYISQKGGKTAQKITSKPSFLNTQTLTKLGTTVITDTTIWRDCYPSTYIPRIYSLQGGNSTLPMPVISALPIRGFKAIYNDMLRHKVLDSVITEYYDDAVSAFEFTQMLPVIGTGTSTGGQYYTFCKRGRRKDSYYTNYRTQSEGQDYTISPMYTDLMEHNEWQKKIAESRSQAENEQMNDWDIVAKLRGSIPISDGKVQFLGMKEIGMNYQQVSQTTYNTADINTDQQVLGATGAFSYTEFNVNLINYHQFKEDGYIHVIAQTSADTVFETGLDRNELNVKWDTEYRPDFKNLKEDTLLAVESNGLQPLSAQATGFKRKYSENFKLANIINGDMTSTPIYEITQTNTVGNPVPLKKEFQFFETADNFLYNEDTGLLITKERWKDYTDLLINKNLAVRETINNLPAPNTTWVGGANQIFMIANAICVTNQPIDESIKQDFKTWGEQ